MVCNTCESLGTWATWHTSCMPALEYTPVRARTSKVVHATSLHEPGETACGIQFRGWVIAVRALTCAECKLAMFMDARPKRGVRRRRAGT